MTAWARPSKIREEESKILSKGELEYLEKNAERIGKLGDSILTRDVNEKVSLPMAPADTKQAPMKLVVALERAKDRSSTANDVLSEFLDEGGVP